MVRSPIFRVLLTALLAIYGYTKYHRLRFKPALFGGGHGRGGRVFKVSLTSTASNSDSIPPSPSLLIPTAADDYRKWFTLTHNRRADVYISEAAELPHIVADLWKAILIAVRLMENDQQGDMMNYQSLHAFPRYSLGSLSDTKALDDVKEVAAEILKISTSSMLFQPNFQRSMEVLVKPAAGLENPATVLVFISTRRTKPALADFDDIENFELPLDEEPWTNDLKSFPFNSIYDFISEISRPPDPATMAELSFDYKVTDFKYDLVKMAQKKNPAEVVRNINVKLTRLQKWRNVLSAPDENDTPDPFVDASDWSERVKRKYASLKALVKNDTAKAMETQYDKRAVFINFIDKWSERLKRAFKFTYFASKRPPENFEKAIMDSEWRNDVLNTTRLFSETPFLAFTTPLFTPGEPAPLFSRDRSILYGSDFSVPVVMYEMLAWLSKNAAAQALAGLSTNQSILHHTYSRGAVTENCMHDVWLGLLHWIAALDAAGNVDDRDIDKDTGKKPPSLSAAVLSKGLSNQKPRYMDKEDHTEEFLSALRGINKLAREKSVAESSSVKELFKNYHQQGKNLTEWWTTMVRDLDLMEEMEERVVSRDEPWSSIMAQVCVDENSFSRTSVSDGIDAVIAAKLSEENAEIWETRYKNVMKFSEDIQELLPCEIDEAPNQVALDFLDKHLKKVVVNDATPIVDFAVPDANGDPSLLFIAPRFFRGIGLDNQELSAFLEFSKLVADQVQKRMGVFLGSHIDSSKYYIEVIPLHPLMTTPGGEPVLFKRAPHPSLLLTLRSI